MMQKKQICFFVGSDSCENSNLFLRKFYEELSHSFKMGWFSYSYREENNLVHMGSANFGEMSFDYKEKGKIHNIYIETDESSETLVREALANAKENYLNSLKTFTVFVKVNCDYVLFANMAKHNISFSYDLNCQSKCNSLTKEDFGGSSEAKRLSWTVVQLLLNKKNILVTGICDVCSFREIFT